MRLTVGGDDFPSPCLFCGHTRNGEGICQCPPDCSICTGRDPVMVSCCGRAVVVDIRIAPLGGEPDINHPRALLTAWQAEARDLNAKRLAAESYGQQAEAAVFGSALATLRRCTEELRNRLLWSGL